jgi:hypothetical protein
LPSRRNTHRRTGARIAGAIGSAGLRILARALRRPVDTVAILCALAATIIIVVNALFLQTGAHPAPFFANPAPRIVTGELRPKNPEPAAIPAAPAQAIRTPPPPQPQTVNARRDDPIADLIGPSPRILAAQRVLTEYGYGQIKPSGMLDRSTRAAIEKFERDHKLPVTGRVTDRLLNDLASMTGHALD